MSARVRLTDAQHFLLVTLRAIGDSRTRDLVCAFHADNATYDRVHALLARLEKRGLVARLGAGSGGTWYLTSEGRQAIE